MSIQPTKFVTLVVLGTFVTGCSQVASPSMPSPVVLPPVSITQARSVPADTPRQSVVAQVHRALNLVTSALEQLELYINHPGPDDPNDQGDRNAGDPNDHGDRKALDFFVKANDVLDDVAASLSTIQTARVHIETAVEYAVMLALYIVVCITAISLINPTCGVRTCPPPRPSDLYPQIIEQAQHGITVANQLKGNVTPQ